MSPNEKQSYIPTEVSEDNPVTCSTCLSTFTDQLSFDLHECRSADEAYECDTCGKRFTRQINFRLHKRLDRRCGELYLLGEDEEESDTVSKGIRIVPKYSTEQKKRVLTAWRPYPCGICRAIFASKSSLTKHIIMHPGLPTSRCGLCGKLFPARQFLQIHCNSHTESRCVTCGLCNKKFLSVAALEDHKKAHEKEERSSENFFRNLELFGTSFEVSKL